jgi:hypothetical protein
MLELGHIQRIRHQPHYAVSNSAQPVREWNIAIRVIPVGVVVGRSYVSSDSHARVEFGFLQREVNFCITSWNSLSKFANATSASSKRPLRPIRSSWDAACTTRAAQKMSADPFSV